MTPLDDGFFHLTYCTNIHPGERWEEVFETLKRHAPALKGRLRPGAPFGLGLRLSDLASRELDDPGRLAAFRDWLADEGLYVFCMNGFPFGGFHRQRVKDDVYAPDWRTDERAGYTLRLARLLAALLPDELDHGGVSTAPLSYKRWLAADEYEPTLAASADALADLTADLVRLRSETGKRIHVDIEPEPDCLLENTDETIDFFERFLFTRGAERLAVRLGTSFGEARERLREHVAVCYDACHFAVEFEEPAEALRRFREAGLEIGRLQISAALQTALPGHPEERDEVAGLLAPFAESTYLHQTIERRADGSLFRYPDLPEALANRYEPDARAWRVHYHVPIFAGRFGGLTSTQQDLADTLARVVAGRVTPFLEVETYTWDVLPDELRLDLTDSIERELRWVLAQLP